jgi:hypothetical protein
MGDLFLCSPPLVGGGSGGGGTFPLTSILSHGGERKTEEMNLHMGDARGMSVVFTIPYTLYPEPEFGLQPKFLRHFGQIFG